MTSKVGDWFTTKDTKSTKESENETLDSIFENGVVEVLLLELMRSPALMSASFMQVSIWDFIDFHLRDLRALRGNPTPPTTVENRYIGDLRSGV